MGLILVSRAGAVPASLTVTLEKRGKPKLKAMTEAEPCD